MQLEHCLWYLCIILLSRKDRQLLNSYWISVRFIYWFSFASSQLALLFKIQLLKIKVSNHLLRQMTSTWVPGPPGFPGLGFRNCLLRQIARKVEIVGTRNFSFKTIYQIIRIRLVTKCTASKFRLFNVVYLHSSPNMYDVMLRALHTF